MMDFKLIISDAIYRIQEKEKEKNWKRILVNSEIEEAKRYKFAIHHGFKSTIPSKKLKAIRVGNKIYSETEALRLITVEEVKRILKRNALWRGTADLKMLNLFFPFIVKTGFYTNELIYRVDIKACFYTIYSRAGLDARVKYQWEDKKIKYISMGKGYMNKVNSQLVDEIGTRKDLRNALYGLTRSCFCNLWKNGQWERTYFKSELLNVELHGFIVLLLHALLNIIEKEALILYWNIDGGFLSRCNIEKIKEIFMEFGFILKSELVEYVDIQGIGSYEYKINSYIHQTGHYKNGIQSTNKLNLYKVENLKEFIKDYKKLYGKEIKP